MDGDGVCRGEDTKRDCTARGEDKRKNSIRMGKTVV